MTIDVHEYRAEIARTCDHLHEALGRCWQIADATDRRRVGEDAHREALERLTTLRGRYESAVNTERDRLVRQAFTPWHSEPADRSAFEAVAAELDERIGDDEALAYRILDEARSTSSVTSPLVPLAVFRIAWSRGWRDLVALGRTTPDLERRFGRNGIDVLLDFEARVAEFGPAAFDLAPLDTFASVSR